MHNDIKIADTDYYEDKFKTLENDYMMRNPNEINNVSVRFAFKALKHCLKVKEQSEGLFGYDFLRIPKSQFGSYIIYTCKNTGGDPNTGVISVELRNNKKEFFDVLNYVREKINEKDFLTNIQIIDY